MARRLLSVLCCGLVAMNLAACGAKSPQNIFDEGMSQFGNGKSEENYFQAITMEFQKSQI